MKIEHDFFSLLHGAFLINATHLASVGPSSHQRRHIIGPHHIADVADIADAGPI